MILDLHFHTSLFSSCSRIALLEGIKKAKEIGLDGICLTEHDVFHQTPELDTLAEKFGLKIFIGTEIYTADGDILCYGLDRMPPGRITASALVAHLNRIGGASIAAHPFRKNNRGIKDQITMLPNLTAVEAFNGNTTRENNLLALELARQSGLPVTGGSDAHSLERIGFFATQFDDHIESVTDLTRALRQGNYRPVRYSGAAGSFERLL